MQKIFVEPIDKIDPKTLEEIKKIRTNISFLDKKNKVISITSSVGREGKSMISFWLSRTLAEAGKKVVLIDGNLRKEEKINIFEIFNDHESKNHESPSEKKKKNMKQAAKSTQQNTNNFLTGKTLKKYLMGKIKKDEIIFESNINNMYFVLSGRSPENASELLSDYSFGALITYLRDNFDYIIVDTPAVGEVTDGVIISQHCDGCILVMEPGIVNYQMAQRVKDQIEFSKCKILGVVLNKIYS